MPLELMKQIKIWLHWEKIEAAAEKKEEGNVWFKVGKYARASKRYEKALSFVEYDSSFSEEEKQLLKLGSTILHVKLRLNDYKEAKELCTEVLLYTADYVKK